MTVQTVMPGTVSKTEDHRVRITLIDNEGVVTAEILLDPFSARRFGYLIDDWATVALNNRTGTRLGSARPRGDE